MRELLLMILTVLFTLAILDLSMKKDGINYHMLNDFTNPSLGISEK